MSQPRQGNIARVGEAWNRFWFTGEGERAVTSMRVVAGFAGLVWLAALTPLLTSWLTGEAWLSIEAIREWRQRDPLLAAGGYLSFWNWIDQPAAVTIVHVASIVAMVLVILGIGGRWTVLLGFWVVLSYLQRLQPVIGAFEYVLSCWFGYLVIAPGRTWPGTFRWGDRSTPAWLSGLARRAIQVHLAMIYAAMGLTKLSSQVWWQGEGVWWLIGQSSSPLVDWTALRSGEYLLNGWTHAVVIFELAMATLIWVPAWRGFLRYWGLVHWLLLGLVTGQMLLAMLMAATSWVVWRDDSNCTREGFAYIL